MTNLLKNIPTTIKEEIFENILLTDKFKLERIISKGHSTPPGQWYDQEQSEWVMIIQGSADITMEGQAEPVSLVAGDCILLPAHLRHRVEKTDQQQETIWLALHF